MMLSAMYSEVKRFPDAIETARRALDVVVRSGDNAAEEAIRARIAQLEAQSH
jgi:hypothetical protein